MRLQQLLGAPMRAVLLEVVSEALFVTEPGGACGVGITPIAARASSVAGRARYPRLTEVRAAMVAAVITLAIGAFTAWRSRAWVCEARAESQDDRASAR